MADIQLRVTRDQILEIMQGIFAALLDDGETLVHESSVSTESFAPSFHAWVDIFVSGTSEGRHNQWRCVVSAERTTVEEISRILLMLDSQDAVDLEDLVDVFGEIANVVGGNVKALLGMASRLSLPSVSAVSACDDLTLVEAQHVQWRERSLSVSIWEL